MKLLYLHDGSYDVISSALKRGFEEVSFTIEDFNHSWYPFMILIFYGLISHAKYQGH